MTPADKQVREREREEKGKVIYTVARTCNHVYVLKHVVVFSLTG